MWISEAGTSNILKRCHPLSVRIGSWAPNFMGLEKAVYYGKEHRKPYRKSKRFDRTCRNHGSCPWCERQRKFNSLKREFAAKQDMREYLDGL